MAVSPIHASDFISLLAKSALIDDASLEALGELPDESTVCAAYLVGKGVLTKFQARQLLSGRHKGLRLGAYVIRDQIGLGGMGAVYLAEHETLRRKVALKVLTLPKAGNAVLSIERFLREARSAAALDHPNIVRLHDTGKQGDIHYIVMEYVEGQTLEQQVARSGTISSSRAVDYIAQAAAGLQHASDKGFVHRDIKPANLMLAKDGTIKILDMGLARPTDQSEGNLTEMMDKGAIVGTADFISPEQAMNGPLDVRSDIYSLGATFYAIVTGQPPFSGNTTQKLIQHQMKTAPSVATLDKTFPPGLSVVVAKMLEKKPENRYQNPADVIQALAEWLPQQAGARVAAAISSTGMSQSSGLSATLSEIASGGTLRIGSNPQMTPVKPKRNWLWPAVAGAVFVVAGCVAAIVSLAGGEPAGGSPIASVSGPVKATAPPQSNPANERTPLPISTVPAAAPIPAPVIYSLDLSKQKSFLERGRNSIAGTGARRWVTAYKEGEGQMPLGWLMTTTKTDTVAETGVADVDGQPAMGYRCLEGTNTIFMRTPTFTSLTGKFIVSFEYTAPDRENLPTVRYQQETFGRKWMDLPRVTTTGTNEWKRYKGELSLVPGVAGSLEFRVTGQGREFVWFRNFSIIQGGDPTEKPLRTTPLFSLNFNNTGTGTEEYPLSDKAFVKNSLNGKDIHPAISINQHKTNVSSEYSIQDIQGARAFGFRMIEGNVGVQIQSGLNDTFVHLKPGETVTVKVAYFFDGTGEGSTTLELPYKPHTKIGRWTLPPTNGEWRTVEFPFTRPNSTERYQLIINAGDNSISPRAHGTIWVKSIEVVYADAQ